jgi:cytochrome c biogenesis protein CcdA
MPRRLIDDFLDESILHEAGTWPGLGCSGAIAASLWGTRGEANPYQGLVRDPRAPSVRSYAKYGAVYGLASLSYTLPAFLAVIATSLLSGGYLAALIQFVLFGMGMAAVLATMTILVGWLADRPHRALRRFSRHAVRVSGVLLLLAGGYLVYYWLSVWPILRSTS